MIQIRNLRLEPGEPLEALPLKAAKQLRIGRGRILCWKLRKRSLDARRKDDIHYICTLLLTLDGDEEAVLKKARCGSAQLYEEQDYVIPRYTPETPPVVVGFGPAGMFAALALARAGARPLVIERGQDVDTRQRDVERLREQGILDPESNEYLVVSSGLRDGSYAVNALQKDIAWQDTPDSFGSPVVHMMNLDTGSKKELNSGAGQILKPVGYIDRDLAVGIAESENTWEINGTVRELPFTAVEIVDDALVSQEHYEEPGYCISDVEVLDSRIHLSRVRKTGEHSFRKAGTDTIVCNVPAEGVPRVASENTELREKTYVIPFPHGFSGKNVRVISSAAVNSLRPSL